MVKAFNLTPDFILHEMSYPNMLLYSASLPRYRSPKEKGGKTEQTINGDDPRQQAEIDKLFDESNRHR